MSRERLVIIGGDAGGMSAAAQARRMRADLEIVAFERGDYTSYSACGLPYVVGGVVADFDRLVARTPAQFQAQGIDARVRHEVEAIDLKARRLTVRALDTQTVRQEAYDQLVYATGGIPVRPELPGSDVRGIHGLQTMGDGIRLAEMMTQTGPKTAVVIGGGYIGLEVAEALIQRGLDVSLVNRTDAVMTSLDPDMSDLVGDALRAEGVHLYPGESAEAFESRAGMVTAVVTARRTLPADLVILGIGTAPNAGLAREAGIPLGATGAVKVNDRLQTEADGVWSAGDCAESFHLVSGRWVNLALGTIANKQGRICGINLGGREAHFRGVVGTAVTKVCALEVARTGLHEQDLEALGIPYVTARIESTTRAGYYPGAGTITVKVLAEKKTGRLLGAQIIGVEGAAKRIDAFATALHARMTVQEFQYLDLSYAPPFSPVWDPTLIAARKAAEQIA
ncbi:MAG TPA: FAD-dependent oxidoreductase [Candidatus Dormibacteraeota bacterium]|jgi:NADPH-dependent 2,4-dienoyl-CoA reductase/sulfur reductase-like enzyme